MKKYLQKAWARIFIALLGGGFVSEIVHISTGDPNRPTDPAINMVLVFGSATIIYFILTNIAKKPY